jgi:hypothetical protein
MPELVFSVESPRRHHHPLTYSTSNTFPLLKLLCSFQAPYHCLPHTKILLSDLTSLLLPLAVLAARKQKFVSLSKIEGKVLELSRFQQDQ